MQISFCFSSLKSTINQERKKKNKKLLNAAIFPFFFASTFLWWYACLLNSLEFVWTKIRQTKMKTNFVVCFVCFFRSWLRRVFQWDKIENKKRIIETDREREREFESDRRAKELRIDWIRQCPLFGLYTHTHTSDTTSPFSLATFIVDYSSTPPQPLIYIIHVTLYDVKEDYRHIILMFS